MVGQRIPNPLIRVQVFGPLPIYAWMTYTVGGQTKNLDKFFRLELQAPIFALLV